MDHHQLSKHHKIEGKSDRVRILVGIAQSYKEVVFEKKLKVFFLISFIVKLAMSIPRDRALNGNMYVENVHNLRLICNKFICKVKKRTQWNTLFGHIGNEISKTKTKNSLDFNMA